MRERGTSALEFDSTETSLLDPLQQLRLHRIGLLRTLQLENSGDWCYANAGSVSLIWALFQRGTFCLEDLGGQILALGRFFTDMETSASISLAQTP